MALKKMTVIILLLLIFSLGVLGCSDVNTDGEKEKSVHAKDDVVKAEIKDSDTLVVSWVDRPEGYNVRIGSLKRTDSKLIVEYNLYIPMTPLSRDLHEEETQAIASKREMGNWLSGITELKLVGGSKSYPLPMTTEAVGFYKKQIDDSSIEVFAITDGLHEGFTTLELDSEKSYDLPEKNSMIQYTYNSTYIKEEGRETILEDIKKTNEITFSGELIGLADSNFAEFKVGNELITLQVADELELTKGKRETFILEKSDDSFNIYDATVKAIYDRS
ncbi:hypothetical protein GGQ84_000334 [Desulfitispora alkaliphila]|uniref:hypothetical protein n=1 Tax=Desulfitispora alkaliphila TaxID=622674 RepID=UPI003D1BC213